MNKKMQTLSRTKMKLVTLVTALLLPASALAQWSTGKSNAAGAGLPTGTIYEIIRSVLYWLLGIFGFIAIIGFVISGIMYLTAAGDEDQQKKAKKQMYWSLTGVIVGLIGLVIVYAVDRMLNAGNYQF